MATPNPMPQRAPLRRPRVCLVTGVAEGLGRHLGVPAWAVRAIFVLLVPLAGTGILLYAWFWALVPWDPAAESGEPQTVTRRAPVAWALVGLGGLTGLLTVFSLVIGPWEWLVWAPLTVVFAVAAAFWTTFVDRHDPERGPAVERIVRLAAFAELAVLLVVVVWGQLATSIAGLVVALLLLVGIGLVYAPLLISRYRELADERTRRIREEQRSEIAAHLHDSVLQTLALIQTRAGATSEVARIARAQERELRDWLYAGELPPEADLGTDLRDFAAALEIDYPVTFDVVEVGDSTERASGELASAAREAMLNAARHAGGEVSVYIEGGAARVDVYVRDRGPGFQVAKVPGDRLGVRESIIGRMRRAGGVATVAAGVGGVGTEVHLGFGMGENRDAGPEPVRTAREAREPRTEVASG